MLRTLLFFSPSMKPLNNATCEHVPLAVLLTSFPLLPCGSVVSKKVLDSSTNLTLTKGEIAARREDG